MLLKQGLKWKFWCKKQLGLYLKSIARYLISFQSYVYLIAYKILWNLQQELTEGHF